MATAENGNVLQHGLAALTKARGLDGDRLECAPNLVDYQGRQGFTLNVFGDDDKGFARLHHFFQYWKHVLNRRDLRANQQHVGVIEHALHPLRVSYEVRRDVTLVEPHTFNEVEFHTKGLALFYGDHSVGADFLQSFGDHRTDLRVRGRDCGHVRDLRGVGINFYCTLFDRIHRGNHCGLDTFFEHHRVGSRSNVAESFPHHGPRENGGGSSSVTGDIVGLLGDFLD